jgi:hypothetical protein
LDQDQTFRWNIREGVEYFGEGLFTNADQADPLPVFAGFFPALSTGDRKSGESGAVESAGEAPTDFSHADDMNAWYGNFNHLKTC